jgi:hypothetical protein
MLVGTGRAFNTDLPQMHTAARRACRFRLAQAIIAGEQIDTIAQALPRSSHDNRRLSRHGETTCPVIVAE